MISGTVDDSGRALNEVSIRAGNADRWERFHFWVDTAFTGDLVLPASIVRRLGLTQTSTVDAGLADGSETTLESFNCEIDWFGLVREVEVIANDGRLPLLGVGLLLDHRLCVDYTLRTLTID